MQNNRVKSVRKALGLTLEAFGARVGVTKQTVSRIENGVNNLTDQMAKSICREYHVNYQWLITGEGEMFQNSDDDVMDAIERIMSGENEFHKNLFRIFARLDDSELATLERIIEKLHSGESSFDEKNIEKEVNAYRADLELEARRASSVSGMPDAKEA